MTSQVLVEWIGRASQGSGGWSDAHDLPLQKTKRRSVSHNSRLWLPPLHLSRSRPVRAHDSYSIRATKGAHSFECVRPFLVPHGHTLVRIGSSSLSQDLLSVAPVGARKFDDPSTEQTGNLLLLALIQLRLLRRPIPLEYPSACNLIVGSVQGPHRFLQGSPAFVHRSRTSP